MSDEPSPRPWQVIKMLGIDEDDVSVFVVDAHNSAIARMVAYAENDKANAALIVSAVNERDRLRDALERIVRYEDGIVGCIESGHASGIDWDGITFAMIQEARAALGEDKE